MCALVHNSLLLEGNQMFRTICWIHFLERRKCKPCMNQAFHALFMGSMVALSILGINDGYVHPDCSINPSDHNDYFHPNVSIHPSNPEKFQKRMTSIIYLSEIKIHFVGFRTSFPHHGDYGILCYIRNSYKTSIAPNCWRYTWLREIC